ncbi:hypothetical protein BS47DRAFT_1294586 [Hydnum rufescens UP504]|uniref:Glutathione S-transferase n=1 Tax=Hydnum rufescens UP504 TaxID=1448309 RepID=A0A9P6AZK0_9AGAM|nr:hypothetical protein BS47DRAFT_1294586 [Hydnum rufescens UP504]
MSKPTLTLYTAATPNGYKVSTLLEELKLAYPDSGLSYDLKELSFQRNEQKEPSYLKINPNGRIPAIVHHRPDGSDFAVFESAAIFLYLVQRFDPDYKLHWPAGSDEESEALQWIFFVHGGVGPMQGQANHFHRYAPERIPYATQRYISETKRLYSVLESRLEQGRDYLVGSGRGKLSIADLNAWPWVRRWDWSGVEDLDAFPKLAAWLDRIAASPGVQIGLTKPAGRQAKLSPEEADKVAAEARSWIVKETPGNDAQGNKVE